MDEETKTLAAEAVREYLFDVKLLASIRVKAGSDKEAEVILREVFDSASCNAGAFSDGSPILFEASIDGALDLIEINGVSA